MNRRLSRTLDGIKQAVLDADPATAISRIDDLAAILRRGEVPAEGKARCAALLGEVHGLAEASAKGTARAIEQVRAILEAARNLQAYDENGRRVSAPVSAPAPQRF